MIDLLIDATNQLLARLDAAITQLTRIADALEHKPNA
jgi:hypothetical protein